eukprot:2100641-Prymnesium_polylepis.1
MCHAGTRSDACGPDRARVLSVGGAAGRADCRPVGSRASAAVLSTNRKSDGGWHESKCAVRASGAHALTQSVTGRGCLRAR